MPSGIEEGRGEEKVPSNGRLSQLPHEGFFSDARVAIYRPPDPDLRGLKPPHEIKKCRIVSHGGILES